MKKIILVAGLLLFATANSWAENYDQCAAKAADEATNANEYDEYIEACRLLDKETEKKIFWYPETNKPLVGIECKVNNEVDLSAVIFGDEHSRASENPEDIRYKKLQTRRELAIFSIVHPIKSQDDLYLNFDDAITLAALEKYYKGWLDNEHLEEGKNLTGWTINRSTLRIQQERMEPNRFGEVSKNNTIYTSTWTGCEVVDAELLYRKIKQRDLDLSEGIKETTEEKVKNRKF